MKLLLVHQNFPGQFRDLGPALCDRGHELKAIGSSQRSTDPRIEVLRYEHSLGERSGVHPVSYEVDEWIHRSEKVANLAMSQKQRGWAPDVMLAHPGWGEALLLRQVFPSTPLVIWPELWLRSEHMGINPAEITVGQMQYLRIKDWLIDGAMSDASLAILPTSYQASTFPERCKAKLQWFTKSSKPCWNNSNRSTNNCRSHPRPRNPRDHLHQQEFRADAWISNLMRALPFLLANHQTLQVVIVGGNDVSYQVHLRMAAVGGINARGRDQIDQARVHLFDRMPHDQLQNYIT